MSTDDTDPRSRRKFIGRDHGSGIPGHQVNAREVIKRAERVIEAMTAVLDKEGADDDGVVCLLSGDDTWAAVKRAYENANDLERYVPPVMCWLVGYQWAGSQWSTWWGCRHENQAMALQSAAKRADNGQRRNWEVRYGACRPLDLVKKTYSPDDVRDLLGMIG